MIWQKICKIRPKICTIWQKICKTCSVICKILHEICNICKIWHEIWQYILHEICKIWRICQNMHNMPLLYCYIYHIFCILQYAKYNRYGPCTIFCHIIYHIDHIDWHITLYHFTYCTYYLVYSAYIMSYSAYCNMQNMTNMDPALFFVILFAIYM